MENTPTERLLLEIRRSGKTQQQICKESSVLSETRLSKILRGNRHPSHDELTSLAQILGIQLESLVAEGVESEK